MSLFVIAGMAAACLHHVDPFFRWDEGVYLASARLVSQGALLFDEVFSSQPPAFLEALALAFRLFGDTGETASRLGVVFATLCMLAVAWLAAGVGGPWAAPFAVLALCSHFFLAQSTRVESEMPPSSSSLRWVFTASVRPRP